MKEQLAQCKADKDVLIEELRLCEQLGMDTYDYREDGAQRTFAWCKKGDLSASDIAGRLRLHREFEELCWRAGATTRTQDKRYPRCA